MSKTKLLYELFKTEFEWIASLTMGLLNYEDYKIKFCQSYDAVIIESEELLISIIVSPNQYNPQVLLSENGFIIQLHEGTIFSKSNFIFQFGHEIIHALFGECNRKNTLSIEEGFAVWNSLQMLEILSGKDERLKYEQDFLKRNDTDTEYKKYYNYFCEFIESPVNKIRFFQNLQFNSSSNFHLSDFNIPEDLKNRLRILVY